ncbi:MAG TPA: DHHA1 domain-containing protein [Chloroflexota bacterium]|nr:DHHA1 domain-containing protein [Chloroflexota bacterium]
MTEVGGRSAVTLDRTAFYPTSGGQPHDTGVLGGAPVVDVVDAGDAVLHVLDGVPPAVGAAVAGRIDADRRRDHTQQHTGQHALSQAFERACSLRTVSFHLGAEYCTIDLDTPALGSDAVRRAERLANEVVLEDRPILVHFADASDLTRFGLRKVVERSGEIRIVEIEHFDRSACGGTHVQRTGQIGPIKVRRWERRGNETRVEFLCGWRTLRDHAERLDATRALAERLGARDADLVPILSRALDELDRLRDENAALRGRLLDAEAGKLVDAGTRLPGSPTARLVVAAFENRSPDELKRLASSAIEHGAAVALLGSTGERSHLVFAQQPGRSDDMNALLRQVVRLIGGRGGGSRDLAQGGSASPAPVSPALDEARRLLGGRD